jgi:hypothetical protein
MFRVQSVITFGGEIGAAKGLSLARGAERVLITAEIGWDFDLGDGDVDANADRMSFSLVGVPNSWLDLLMHMMRWECCVPWTILSFGRGSPSACGLRARVVTSWPIRSLDTHVCWPRGRKYAYLETKAPR